MNDYEKLSKAEFIDKYEAKTFEYNKVDNKFIKALILHKISFSIQCSDVSREAQRVEKIIEDNDFTCRVYTENRSALMAAAAIPGAGQAIGLGVAAFVAAHNLATLNPDFEIGKNMMDKQINVTYKKDR